MRQPEFPRRGVLAPLAVVLVLGLGLFAAAQITVSVREPLLLQVGERRLELRIGPESISGDGFELRRVPEGLRGTFEGQPVNLTWDEDGDITGRAAGATVRLSALSRAPQPGLSLRGWFGASPTELTLTPTTIAGIVGGCSYSLPMAGNRYSGWRTCDVTRGPPVPVVLRIPEDAVPLGLAEQGALLALLLSDEALPPASPAGETPGVGGGGTPSP